jgi:type II secretory pathway predicted ATPase ExeA
MIKLAATHYWRQLGLMADPFPAATPLNLYYTTHWQRYIDFLLNTEQYRKSLLLIIGDEGVGKTTLLNQAHSFLENKSKIIKIEANTAFRPEVLLTFLANECHSLPLKSQATLELAADTFLDLLYKQGHHYFLLIDNAELLPQETQALCLSLVKHQALSKPCLQIILAGKIILQEQFEEILKSQEEGLQNYLIQILAIQPFSQEDVSHYLRSQLKLAGDTGKITFFSETEITTIYRSSQGLPMRIQAKARETLQKLVKPENNFSLHTFVSRFKIRPKFLWMILSFLIFLLILWLSFSYLPAYLAHYRSNTTDPSTETTHITEPNIQEENTYTPGSHIIVNGEIHTVEEPQAPSKPEAIVVEPVVAEKPINQIVKKLPPPTNKLMTENDKKIVTKLKTEQLVPRQNQTTAPEEDTSPINPNSLEARERVIINGEIQNLPTLSGKNKNQKSTSATQEQKGTIFNATEKNLLNVSGKHFTVQFFISSDLEEIQNFLNKYNVSNETKVYRTIRQNKLFYVVVGGDFISRHQAAEFISHLNPELQQLKPWTRSLLSVHQDIMNRDI